MDQSTDGQPLSRKALIKFLYCALYILIGVTIFWAISESFHIYGDVCSEEDKSNYRHCTSYNAVEVVAIEIRKFFDAAAGITTAVATGFIAWFTFALRESTEKLWSSAIDQSDMTRESIDLARKEFSSKNRAHIIIRVVTFISPLEMGYKFGAIMFSITNKGPTIGKIEEFTFFCAIKNDENILYPRIRTEKSIPIDIEGGFDEFIIAVFEDDIRDMFVRHITSYELRIRVVYTDTLKRRRETSAHRQYDVATERFRRIEGSDFEYEY